MCVGGMALTRYQIRNEYGLADPELYKAVDRDDPEALLEGVAMLGLVGVLRQLGDLAECFNNRSYYFHCFLPSCLLASLFQLMLLGYNNCRGEIGPSEDESI